MKFTRLIVIAVVVCAVRVLIAQQQPPGSIEGIVSRQGTNQPIARATVELRRSRTEAALLTAITNEDGRFTFPSVQPGEYIVLAFRAGHLNAEYGQRDLSGPGKPVMLRGGQRQSGINLPLTPGAVISGRVTDRGEPAANTTVTVVKVRYELGQRVQQAILSARTNDRGEYRIFWLPPGRYYVWAGPFDYEVEGQMSSTISTGAYAPIWNVSSTGRYIFSTRSLHPATRSEERHMITFYGDTTDLRRAVAVEVGPDGEAKGIDIQANALPSLHVRGVVTKMPSGENVRPRVSLLPSDPSSFISLPSGQTDANGDFELDHVSPGAYIVYASAGNLQARVPIDISDRDVNGITLALSSGVTLAGRIVIEGSTAEKPSEMIGALKVGLLTDPVLGGFIINLNSGASYTGPVTPGADGTFRIPGTTGAGPLPGNYRIFVPPLTTPASGWSAPRAALPQAMTSAVIPSALQNAYLKSIRFGDHDVLNDGLRLSEEPRDSLVVVVGTNAGVIEGRVLDAQQTAMASTPVVLIPESPLKFQINHKYVLTDATGRFRLQNLAPGDYRLFAWEYAEPGSWQDPEFVRKHEAKGELLHINEGDRLTLTVRAIP